VWLYFTPLYVVGFALLLFAVFAVLARVKGGKYLRPIFQTLAKVPILKRLLEKASRAAIERQNPELASAMRKLERSGALKDPMKAQQAMSRLSASERRAWLEAAGQQQDQMPQPSNRAERRRLERLQRETQRRPKR
jgi:hypothetical protein